MININYHSKWLLPLRLLLLPLSLLYGGIMQLRNILYDLGWFKIRRFPVTVISVGNLSAGGSGKTPLTIVLAHMLQQKYGAVAVVSRGYGRQSSGVRLVADGQQILLSAKQAGDEPYLMARKLPGVPVVAAEKRAEGIAFLLQKTKPAVILLDDAFQHRSVFRDLDIVLQPAGESRVDRWPLPAGFYREFACNRRRAGMLLYIHRQSGEHKRIEKGGAQTVFNIHFKSGLLVDWQFREAAAPEMLAGQRIGAFAGIARPQNFLQSLHRLQARVVFFQPFGDHHDYKAAEVASLIARCKRQNCRYLLCTEKDLAKLTALQKEISNSTDVTLLALTLKVEIENFPSFEKKVLQAIDR